MDFLKLVKPQHIAGHDGPSKVPEPRSVVIVGGGLAGCAAAASLADRGVAVTLIEKESFLGGRAGAWTETLADGESFEMERGFHAFFRQYYNLRDFLRRLDPNLSFLSPLEDYPLYGPEGHMESFAGLPHQSPFNLMALVARTETLNFSDLKEIPPWPTAAMLAYDPARTYDQFDDATAKDFLDALNFPARARQMLFEVFAHSFFNPEEGMSAAEMIRMFHFYFTGNPEGLVFDVMNKPFSTGLWDPMHRMLERQGVKVLMNTGVESVARSAERWQVVAGDARFECDGVVLAVTVPALKAIVAQSPDLDAPKWRADVEALDVTLPFVVWRLWLDKPCSPSRYPFAGTAGLGLLDNISLYHLFEDESRRWAERTGGSIVELHAYAVPAELSEAAIRDDLWRHTLEVYPELRGARVIEDRYLHRRDCPSFAPHDWGRRPPVQTPIDGITLAGDFVRLPVPCALMEGATTAGILAANRLLRDFGARGHDIKSVPSRGMLSGLNPFFERQMGHLWTPSSRSGEAPQAVSPRSVSAEARSAASP